MPGVTKEGKPAEGYGYDIGGKTVSIGGVSRGDKMPPEGQLGRLDDLNTDRSLTKKDSGDDKKTYAKTGYESSAFDKSGNIKGGPSSEPKFLEADGSWAPAEGRGGSTSGNVPKRGVYSGTIKK